jgi:hypothetical protein
MLDNIFYELNKIYKVVGFSNTSSFLFFWFFLSFSLFFIFY